MRLELNPVEMSRLEGADQVLRQTCHSLLSRAKSLSRSADADVLLDDRSLEDFDETIHFERVNNIR